MKRENEHGFFQGCYGRPGINRQTFRDRIRLRRRRRKQDDLASLKGRWGI